MTLPTIGNRIGNLAPILPHLIWAHLVTFAGAVVMVGGVSLLKMHGLTTPLQGRKLMHITTGPVFILCWLLYPTDQPIVSAYLAASVPLMIALYMLSNAFGYSHNVGLISTVSRSGSSKELASGPFYYGLIHSAATVLYWTNSPTGIVSLLILCIGDGLADLIGRPYGRHKWSHNREKSIEGTLTFIISSLIVVWGFVVLFLKMGYFTYISSSSFCWQVPFVVVVSGLVESCRLGAYDNVGIFITVVILGHLIGW